MTGARKSRTRIGRLHTRSVPSRAVGWSLFWLCVITLVANWIEEFTDAVTVLPGGHSPFYLVGGITGAGAGLWFAGVMDAKG
ncbi:hypothetical protein AB0M28_38710 [Streptomyces sp. NPDC051940]|uniref:hypothetical protein n=1 Tax=Streptomyces sp. NPDC051940 TaxID=3155675 RepID=UPI003428901F